MRNRQIFTYFGGGLLLVVLVAAMLVWLNRPPPLEQALQEVAADGFNGVLLIADDEQIIHQGAYGFASCDDSVANAVDTVMAIGSVTKMFTRVAIGQLDAAGKLDVDAPISRYLDGVPADKAAITVRQLLDHSAGLRPYHETQNRGDFESMSAAKALQTILEQNLLFDPGDGEAYSNSGYTLLALLIESVSGRSYTNYVRAEIFAPAGMSRSGFWGDSFDNMASTPNELLGCSSPKSWEYSYVLVGNGGMLSTVGDLQRWFTALQDVTLLSESAKERVGLALPLRVGFSDAGGSSQHQFNASISYAGPTDTLVIALSNRDTLRAEAIAADLLLSALLP